MLCSALSVRTKNWNNFNFHNQDVDEGHVFNHLNSIELKMKELELHGS